MKDAYTMFNKAYCQPIRQAGKQIILSLNALSAKQAWLLFVFFAAFNPLHVQAITMEYLEHFDLSELFFVGTIGWTDENTTYAIIQVEGEEAHRVSAGQRLGKHMAVVMEISETVIKLCEIPDLPDSPSENRPKLGRVIFLHNSSALAEKRLTYTAQTCSHPILNIFNHCRKNKTALEQ